MPQEGVLGGHHPRAQVCTRVRAGKITLNSERMWLFTKVRGAPLRKPQWHQRVSGCTKCFEKSGYLRSASGNQPLPHGTTQTATQIRHKTCLFFPLEQREEHQPRLWAHRRLRLGSTRADQSRLPSVQQRRHPRRSEPAGRAQAQPGAGGTPPAPAPPLPRPPQAGPARPSAARPRRFSASCVPPTWRSWRWGSTAGCPSAASSVRRARRVPAETGMVGWGQCGVARGAPPHRGVLCADAALHGPVLALVTSVVSLGGS